MTAVCQLNKACTRKLQAFEGPARAHAWLRGAPTADAALSACAHQGAKLRPQCPPLALTLQLAAARPGALQVAPAVARASWRAGSWLWRRQCCRPAPMAGLPKAAQPERIVGAGRVHRAAPAQGAGPLLLASTWCSAWPPSRCLSLNEVHSETLKAFIAEQRHVRVFPPKSTAAALSPSRRRNDAGPLPAGKHLVLPLDHACISTHR